MGTAVTAREIIVVTGGCCLAFLSAALNVDFLLSTGTSVSHMTGDISRIAPELIASSEVFGISGLRLIAAVSGFVSGAFFAGYLIHQPRLSFAKPYGHVFLIISGCILISYLIRPGFLSLSIFSAAFACGLQNAMATTYKGVILRTTHLTGLLTDLGSNLGMKLRGLDVGTVKLIIPATLSLSFLLGSLFAAIAKFSLHLQLLPWLSALYFIGGCTWILIKPTIDRLPREQ